MEKGERVEAFLSERDREMQELKAQVAEAQRELGAAQRRRTVGDLQLGQLRDEYTQNVQQLASRVRTTLVSERRLRAQLRRGARIAPTPAAAVQVAQLAQAVQIHEADPDSRAAPSGEELRRHFEQLQEELVKTHGAREADLVAALDGAQERQVALRAHMKALALGYRQLRYQVEDAVASGGATLPTKVVHENTIVGATPGNVIAADEVRWFAAMCLSQTVSGTPGGRAATPRECTAGRRPQGHCKAQQQPRQGGAGQPHARLAAALPRARRARPPLATDACGGERAAARRAGRRDSAREPGGWAWRRRVAQRRSRAPARGECAPAGGRRQGADEAHHLARCVSAPRCLSAPLQGSAASLRATVARLATGQHACAERKVKHAEARALLAEKQLEALNAYMAKATHAYQGEIMRLKKALPRGGK